MRESLSLYLAYVGISIRAQMQYRWSAMMRTAAQFLGIGAEALALWALFQRFGHLYGWRAGEVAVLYGVVNMGFALAECIGRGFDMFPALVRSGDFDRLLLRPRSTLLQVSAAELDVRAGRLLQGLIVLAWGSGQLGLDWSILRVLLVLWTVLGGMLVFIGLFVLQATLSFWTVDGLEVLNALTYGGTETAQFPLTIYPRWFRGIFIFAIPLGAISYFPMLVLLGRHDELLGLPPWGCVLMPACGPIFLAATLCLWQVGVRHYRSTGS